MNRRHAIALASGLALGAATAWWRPAPAAIAPARLVAPRVVFHGDDPVGAEIARAALARVFATPIGAQARARLDSGELSGPLTIELNHLGANFTEYRIPGRELGETIHFDPDSTPPVETERGSETARAETVLAHELGHAVFKLRSEQEVIDAVENPVRDQLGLPRRVRF
jgi:hypothetical protein